MINNDIFILQFPKVNNLSFSFSCGKIFSLKDNNIIHSASTDDGSSGSPIIRRSEDNYIIGLHYGVAKNNNKFKLATSFDSILNNIKQQYYNEINCIYIPDEFENKIKLLHDYNLDLYYFSENDKKEYLEVKNINRKIFEENMEIYINNKKIIFNYEYKIKDSKEIKVKFKFKKILTNTSYMFYNCDSLKIIDLSSFNTTNVNNMKIMFSECHSLQSIDLSSFNTTNVNNMSSMFFNCFSLESINLSSFNTTNVNNMSSMFFNCSSLESIDLSSFNTTNVNNMSNMFSNCCSLESIDLSSFNTTNVNNMSYMFSNCSLRKENIKINNKNDKLLKEIKEDLK